jgi:hypothetical protein
VSVILERKARYQGSSVANDNPLGYYFTIKIKIQYISKE